MLEARGSVSGATGRNGGHLVSDSDSIFPALVKAVGLELAVETVRFSEANIRRLRELVDQLDLEDRQATEFRNVTTSTAFEDRESFDKAVEAVRQLIKAYPNGDLKYKVSKQEDATKVRNEAYAVGFFSLLTPSSLDFWLWASCWRHRATWSRSFVAL